MDGTTNAWLVCWQGWILAQSQKQTAINNNEPIWEWQPGVPIVLSADNGNDGVLLDGELVPLADVEPDYDDPPLLVPVGYDSESDSDDDDDDELVIDAVVVPPVGLLDPPIVTDADADLSNNPLSDLEFEPAPQALVDDLGDDVSFDVFSESRISFWAHFWASCCYSKEQVQCWWCWSFPTPATAPLIVPAAHRSEDLDSESATPLCRSMHCLGHTAYKVHFNIGMDNTLDADTNTKSYSDVQLQQQHGLNVYKQTDCKEGQQWVITAFMFTQMTTKAGIKKHGQVTIDALYKEFLQLT